MRFPQRDHFIHDAGLAAFDVNLTGDRMLLGSYAMKLFCSLLLIAINSVCHEIFYPVFIILKPSSVSSFFFDFFPFFSAAQIHDSYSPLGICALSLLMSVTFLRPRQNSLNMAVSAAVLGCERTLWQLCWSRDWFGSSGQTNIGRKASGMVKQSRQLTVMFDWIRRFPQT